MLRPRYEFLLKIWVFMIVVPDASLAPGTEEPDRLEGASFS